MSASSGPSTESYLSRWAIVFASPRSFTATISRSASRLRAERKKLRPIRPNPLIPTRTLIPSPLDVSGAAILSGRARRKTPVENSGRKALAHLRGADYARRESGSALVGRRIQTPSGVTVWSVARSGGGGRPRSFPSGPLSSSTASALRARPGAGAWPGGGASPPSSPAGGSAAPARAGTAWDGGRGAARPPAARARARRAAPPARAGGSRGAARRAARLVRTMLAWSAFASRFARARVADTTASSPSASADSCAPRKASSSPIVSVPLA